MVWWQGLLAFFVVTITITGCIIALINAVKGRV